MKAICLTIAGSDSGGGAGIQADLKTFAAHGVFGTSALTLVTAQNTRGVSAVQILSPELVRAQIRAVLDDFSVGAIKTGALGSGAIIEAVADELRGRNVPLIVDPVMLAKSGDALLEREAIRVMKERLFPLATLITPNLPEAELLLDLPGGALGDESVLVELLQSKPVFPFLLKGGHGVGDVLHDWLWLPEGNYHWSSPRQHTRHTHGTGCTLSAAIAAQLVLGAALPQAVERARDYVARAIEAAPGLGSGAGPLEHFPYSRVSR